MTKYYLSSIDTKVNKTIVGCDEALKNIKQYILQDIDPTFPESEFNKWVDSDSEKPFRWNRNLFYWDKKEQ